jgi:hypothetical protein
MMGLEVGHEMTRAALSKTAQAGEMRVASMADGEQGVSGRS